MGAREFVLSGKLTGMATIAMHRTRDVAYSSTLPKHGIGAELGVLAGRNAASLWSATSPKTMFLVDNWRHASAERGTVELMAKAEPRLKVVTADSVSWLKEQASGSLDWAYLDTTHWYDDTCRELHELLRVVRQGGVIAMHDFVIEPPTWRGGVVIPALVAIAHGAMQPIAVTNERFPTIFCKVI